MTIEEVYNKLGELINKGFGGRKIYVFNEDFNCNVEVENISMVDYKIVINRLNKFECFECGKETDIIYETGCCCFCEECLDQSAEYIIEIKKL